MPMPILIRTRSHLHFLSIYILQICKHTYHITSLQHQPPPCDATGRPAVLFSLNKIQMGERISNKHWHMNWCVSKQINAVIDNANMSTIHLLAAAAAAAAADIIFNEL
jgi:hypothetical protein